MKKIIVLLWLVSNLLHADMADKMWASISTLETKTVQLQNQFNALQNQDKTNTAQLQNQINTLQNQINANMIIPKKIGERYHGGIVFWVDDTSAHGLLASATDLNNSQGIQWRNGDSGSKVTNARSDGLYSGETNTRLIVSEQTIDHQKGQFAALLASSFRVLDDGVTPCEEDTTQSNACYGNWYLPSAYELNLMKKNLQSVPVDNLAPEYYWSSTESSVKNAWLVHFATGERMSGDKANAMGHIRAVSRF